MTIPGKDFAAALFSVWLGTKPVNSALQRECWGIPVPTLSTRQLLPYGRQELHVGARVSSFYIVFTSILLIGP